MAGLLDSSRLIRRSIVIVFPLFVRIIGHIISDELFTVDISRAIMMYHHRQWVFLLGYQ
jgi:positive regulator of sigma E activity